MFNPLVDIKVRQDWQEVTQRLLFQRNRLWRIAELAIIAATLVLLFHTLFLPAVPWHDVLRTILFSSILWLLPLWLVYSRVGYSLAATVLRVLAVFLLIAGVVAIAYATLPGVGVQSWLDTLPILAVPVITWTWLIIMRRRYPVPLRMMGLTAQSWPINIVIGVAAGLLLGLHLLLATTYLPATRPQPAWSPELLLWVLCFRVGISATGEELFFRGMGYQLLYDGTPRSLWSTIARVSLLSLPVFLAPLWDGQPEALAPVLLLLIYSVAFSALATLLRHHQHSLVPGLACNVVFSLFLMLLLVP